MDLRNIEDTLRIKSWGKWASEGIKSGKIASPPWAKQYQAPWKDDPDELLVPIDDDYGMRLDKEMLGLEEKQRKMIVMIYVWKMPVTSIAKALNTRRQSVYDDQKNALWYL